jgi:CxxC motif-containing protein
LAEELKKELICILCPLGCKMSVSEDTDNPDDLVIRGQQCKIGRVYAVEEYTNPTRTLTSTVVINNAPLARLPVKTNKPLPKSLIFKAMEEINRVELTAPVKMNTVVIENLLDTGIDIVTTRSLSALVD